jgi:tetratricopeptide (TPR) repeat protein
MLATQRPEAAIACYERALALRADYLEALIGRAGAKKQLQCFDEALAGLNAALALEPRSDHARNNKAVLLLPSAAISKRAGSFTNRAGPPSAP